ncbi:MSA 2 and/or Asp protease 2 domain containing protein [Asbolus verrucosus]|uniref:MSA 2 and/or Asp protease 2 domain containing protein n=1 Tax=Asbolus verrucosus TaxID=1661398 RepID=A0A482WAY5_ASBVE|nr:MSA 2 and/or Asp protease 2 domain containing protein [Asbolus verrucosus]
MSRRHHHHNIQPYDYERFSDHSRDRDQTRGIEYQDDSLSSINSDEESYLHHHPHVSKDKKGNFFNSRTESSSKSNKPEKSTNNESYLQKEVKTQTHPSNNSDPSSTSERLGRLEAMLEELIKRNSTQPQPAVSPVPSAPEKASSEKGEGQYCLEPRRHDFTTSLWINKIQEVSIQNNWSEKSTIQYMGTQMSGIVKAWYNSLPNYDFTWPEWKILISKIFPDNTDFVTTLKRLVTRLKQADESITTYYFSKMYLIEACKITGEDAVSCLIDGLNNQVIQEQAKTQNFLTPETLYSQFLMVLPDYTVDYSPTVASTTESVLNNWYYREQKPNIEQDNAEVTIPQEELFEYEKEPRNEDFDYRNQGNSTFHSKEDSGPHSVKLPPKRAGTVHSRLDKRFIRSNNFRHHNKIPMAARVCSICFNRGHLARNCRKNVDKMMCCTLLSSELKSCFYKDCTINNHKLEAFVDTGCTTVTIRQREARELDLTINSTLDWIQIYGGDFVQVLGEVNIILEVDSVRAQVRAVVVPDHVQNVSVIIGQAFLTQKNVSMFLHNETLKISEAPGYSCKLTD